jgi:hypothetical protein
VVPEWVQDVLNKVSPASFQQMLDYAVTRRDLSQLQTFFFERFFERRLPCISKFLGRDAYVELRVLRDAALLEADYDWGSGPKLFVVDAKCYTHNHNKGTRLSVTYPIPAPYLRHVLGSLFAEPAKRDTKAGAFQAGDVALFFDGRAGGHAAAIAKEIAKFTKKNPQLKVRPTTVVRLMYHNREFRAGGIHALQCVKTGLHAKLPEPLENMYVVPHRLTSLQMVDRKYLDLPGDIRSRGVANLFLRSAEESGLSLVSLRVAKLALPDTAQPQAADEGEADNDSGASAAETPDAVTQAEDDGSTNLLPWESPELMAREWLNLFGCNGLSAGGEKRLIVDFAAGGGALATACCRLKFKYLGFVQSDAQRSIIKDSIVLKIVTELILNKEDGFQLSRFLSRERSAGGANVPDKLQAEPATSVNNGDSKAQAGGSSSSSSSSDDDE